MVGTLVAPIALAATCRGLPGGVGGGGTGAGRTINHTRVAPGPPQGSVNAISWPGSLPPPTARTRYCLPSSMYVIGDPVCIAGRGTAPSSSPVLLS